MNGTLGRTPRQRVSIPGRGMAPGFIAAAAVVLTASLLGCSSGGPNPQATSSPEPQTLPTAPAAPWKTVWSDSFNGPAGSGVSTANWKYDNGQGIFGTGEAERTTSFPANVHLDGNGNLDIVALKNGSTWTSGRIQTTKAQFVAPAGGEMIISAAIRQPDSSQCGGLLAWFLAPGNGSMAGNRRDRHP